LLTQRLILRPAIKGPLGSSFAQFQSITDLSPGRTQPTKLSNLLDAGMHSRPANPFPVSASVPKARPDSFSDQAALQFCDGAQDGENHLSSGGTGIDVL